MKKFLRLALLLIIGALTGCGDDTEETFVTEPILIENGITNVQNIITRGTVLYGNQEIATAYFGRKGGKEWIGLFDKSETLLGEWEGKVTDNNDNTMYYESNLVFSIGDDEFLFIDDGIYTKEEMEEKAQYRYLRSNHKIEDGVEIKWPEGSESQYNERRFINYIANMGVICIASINGDLMTREEFIYDLQGNIKVDHVRTEQLEDGTSIYTGFSDNKLWISLCNKDETVAQEYIGTEMFDKNKKVYLGYNKYDNYTVKYFYISSFLKMKWGYVCLPTYNREKNNDAFLLKEGKIIYVPLANSNSDVRSWYNESVLVGSRYVLSSDGEVLHDGQYSFYNDVNEPVSYTEWIGIDSRNIYIYKKSCEKDGYVWITYLDFTSKYPDNAQYTFTITDKSDKIWTYHCNILNYDGSKEQEKFQVNIETGEITYL